MDKISREEAKSLGMKRFFTGKPCSEGHICERNVAGGYCMDCNKKAVSTWRKKTGYKTDPEYAKRWRSENKDRLPVYETRRNKGKLSANRIKKRAAMRNAVPKWLSDQDLELINKIYMHARDCTVSTGERYEVDHIVPIISDKVCGLHVPWNLQVLPMDMNRSKRNKLIERYLS